MDGVAVCFFGRSSGFKPLIKVSVVFVAVFGGQSDDILLKKFFELDTVKIILCKFFLQRQMALHFFMQAASVFFQ